VTNGDLVWLVPLHSVANFKPSVLGTGAVAWEKLWEE